MPNIFKDGGGAGIGSFIVVFKNGVMAPNTDLVKLRGAYESGEQIYFSIIDDETQDALVPTSGWIGEDGKLNLIARDFDDNKTYSVVLDGDQSAEAEVKDGIEAGGEPLGGSVEIAGNSLVIPEQPAPEPVIIIDDVAYYHKHEFDLEELASEYAGEVIGKNLLDGSEIVIDSINTNAPAYLYINESGGGPIATLTINIVLGNTRPYAINTDCVYSENTDNFPVTFSSKSLEVVDDFAGITSKDKICLPTCSAYYGFLSEDGKTFISYFNLKSDGAPEYVDSIKQGNAVIPIQAQTRQMVEATWAELKDLRDSGKLIPGMQYRMTDYVTTVDQQECRSAGHPFDLILTADTVNQFNENVRACIHAGDTYFEKSHMQSNVQILFTLTDDSEIAYRGESSSHRNDVILLGTYKNGTPCLYKNDEVSYPGEVDYDDYFLFVDEFELDDVLYDRWEKYEDGGTSSGYYVLTRIIVNNGEFTEDIGIHKEIRQYDMPSLWKIQYTIDNDKTRFPWADTVNGKGVIYHLIDENSNDLPYDFKNIQFTRYKVTRKITPSSTDVFNGLYFASSDGDEFTVPNGYDVDSHDSIWCYTFSSKYDGEVEPSDMSLTSDVQDNKIGIHSSLNNIVFFGERFYSNTIGNHSYRNTIDNDFYGNSISDNFRSNTVGENFHSNFISDDFQGNTIGDSFSFNIIGNSFNSNTIRNSFRSNTISNGFISNTVGENFYSNFISDDFRSNTIGFNFYYNTISFSFQDNIIVGEFDSNTISNGFISNTVGSYFSSNTIGNSFNSNTISNYITRCTFGDGIQYIHLTATTEGSPIMLLQYVEIKNGVHGTSSSDKKRIEAERNLQYTVTYKPTGSTEIEV